MGAFDQIMKEREWAVVGGTLLACLVVLLMLTRYEGEESNIPWLEKIRRETDLRAGDFYREPLPSERGVLLPDSDGPQDHRAWIEHRQVMRWYQQFTDELTGPDRRREFDGECLPLSDFERLTTPRCRAWWMAVLAQEEIVNIGITLGFDRREHKLGAMQLIFANGLKGWFKPCGLAYEAPESEVIAGMIDYYLGFDRTPPSVMRNITVSHLTSIVEARSSFFPLDPRTYILDQTYQTCSDRGMLFGAVVGWWTGLEDNESLPKTQAFARRYLPDGVSVREARNKLTPFANAEEVHIHILLYLVNILRVPGKNEFSTRDGEGRTRFLGVDLDRTKLRSDIPDRPTFCTACWVGQETLDRLQAAVDNYSALTRELQRAWEIAGGISQPSLVLDQLHQRLQYTVNCFESCQREYGVVHSVIIPPAQWTIR